MVHQPHLNILDNGWSIGFNVRTKQAGIFPRRNILPIQDGTASIFPPAVPKRRPVYTDDRVEEYVNSDDVGKLATYIDLSFYRSVERIHQISTCIDL